MWIQQRLSMQLLRMCWLKPRYGFWQIGFAFWISFYNLCTFGGVNVFDTQLPCLKMTIILLPLVLICLYEMMSMKQLA